jgi:hypothetical protein
MGMPPAKVVNMIPITALIVGSSLIAVAADAVPTLKVEPSCRAAGIDGIITGRTSESCLNDEKSAREDLTKTWSSFSADDKNHCLSMVSTGGGPSYVELLSCLEMSRDAKLIAKGQAPAQIPARKR